MAHDSDAPLFNKGGSNLIAEDLVKDVGRRKVKYGVVMSNEGTNSPIGTDKQAALGGWSWLTRQGPVFLGRGSAKSSNSDPGRREEMTL